ncbi:MAG: tape measure protein [Erysipelotrichaceae bacterium]|nr:tape measure protein [Erysipelotrichaceae bacterium]
MSDGRIVIDLELSDSEFNSKLDSVSKDVGGFGSKTSGSFMETTKSILAAVGVTKLLSAGWDMVKSSMGGAISRVDTINQYKNTMQALGYSTQDVETAMNSLQTGIDGLPTTMPAIASMQQRYTALTGNIEDATDWTIALNDATLAGGQGQEVAGRAMEHWYSMIANGKPELDHWKEVNAAMPAQMNQLAEALLGTGAKSQDLFNAWQDGTITTEQLMAAMVDLDKNGAEGIDSFHEQAMAASKGIATSMANVKTAIVNQLGNIISAIDGDQHRISGAFDAIKEVIKSVGAQITDFVKAAMPVVDKFFSAMVDKAPQIATAITAIGAGFSAWKIGTILSDSTNSLNMFFTGISNGAGVINMLLAKGTTLGPMMSKLSMSALQAGGGFKGIASAIGGMVGPIGVVAAIIGVLVAAFLHLWNTNEDFRNAIISTWQNIQTAVSGFVSSVAESVNSLGIDWSAVASTIMSVWDAVCNFIGPAFITAFNIVATTVQTVLGVIQGFIQLLSGIFQGDWAMVWEGAKTIFINAITMIVTAVTALPQIFFSMFNGIITSAATWVAEMVLKAVELGTQFITTIVTWFQQLPTNISTFLSTIITNVVAWVSQMIQNAIQLGTMFLTNIVNYLSQLPGRVWQFLLNVINSVVRWVSQMITNAIRAGSQFLASVTSSLSQLPARVAGILGNVIAGLAGWIGRMASSGAQGAAGLVNAVISGLSGLPGQVVSIGAGVASGILQGIQNGWGAIKGWISGMASDLVSTVKSFLGIGSPSRVFAKEVGRWILPGIQVGMEWSMPEALKHLHNTSDALVSKFQSNLDNMSAQLVLEGNFANARSLNAQQPIVYNNNYDMTVNSAKTLRPSEIAQEMKNMQRRSQWQ